MRTHRLRCTVTSERGEFAEDALPEGWAGADALLLFLLHKPPDGSFHVTFFSDDGQSEELNGISGGDLFHLWIILAKRITEAPDAHPAYRDMAGAILGAMTAAFPAGVFAPGATEGGAS